MKNHNEKIRVLKFTLSSKKISSNTSRKRLSPSPPSKLSPSPTQKLKPLTRNPSYSIFPSPGKQPVSKPKNSPTLKPESKKITLSKKRTQSMTSPALRVLIPKPVSLISQALYKTCTGKLSGKPKKENQDSFIIIHNFLSSSSHFFAVCDGHGQYGHQVSRFLKSSFPRFFQSFFSEFRDSENAVQKAYSLSVKSSEIAMAKLGINLDLSGSTLVSVIIIDNLLTCANIGDSRAVLGQKTSSWVALDLSRDHKPCLEDENARIRKSGGRVFSFRIADGSEIGPQRVWLKKDDLPGLAMSRSIGDLIASSVGVTSEAEYTVRCLTQHDRFVIIATDGLWEFVSSQEAVNLVASDLENGKKGKVCENLVRLAVKRWESLDGNVDDITVLVVFFNN